MFKNQSDLNWVSIFGTDTLLNGTDKCVTFFLIGKGSYFWHRSLLFFIILLIKRMP